MKHDDAGPSVGWSAELVPCLGGAAVEWVGADGKMLISRREHLFESVDQGVSLKHIASLPEPLWRSLVTRNRLAQRALRAMYYNVIAVTEDTLFITYGKSIYVIRSGKVVHLDGLVRPTRVLRGGCALAPDGSIYFGEYLPNPHRSEVYVYKWCPSETSVTIAYRFPAQSIRHIHGIFCNPSDGSLWCLTGDLGKECRILRTEDGFKTIDTVGQGDETWRAVSILFTANAAYYGMDAEFIQNRIFRVDTKSGRRDDLGEVNGPIYYSRAVGEDLFFGVTVEPCASQLDGMATIWRVGKEHKLSRIQSWKKDIYPYSLFMPGTLHFSGGSGVSDEFWVHGIGLSGIDDRTVVVRREFNANGTLQDR